MIAPPNNGILGDLSDAGMASSPNCRRVHAPLRVGETVRGPDGSENRILVRGTWNAEIVDELNPEPSDVIVDKHRFSGFYETELDSIQRAAASTRNSK